MSRRVSGDGKLLWARPKQDAKISILTRFFAFLYKSATGFHHRFHKYRFSNVKATVFRPIAFIKSAFDL
jgi:hypothetical protein